MPLQCLVRPFQKSRKTAVGRPDDRGPCQNIPRLLSWLSRPFEPCTSHVKGRPGRLSQSILSKTLPVNCLQSIFSQHTSTDELCTPLCAPCHVQGLNIENRRKNFMASMRMTLRKLCEKGILSKITTQRFKIVRPPLRGKKARASPNKKSSQRAESKAKNKKSSADKTRSRKVNPIKPKQARAAGTRSARASKRRATRTSTLSPTRSSPRITKRNSTRAESQVTTRRSTRNSS